ncbi:alpha/beta hydrolase [Aminobacter sp. MDW-2]|uniref:alpha/beta hydrolase n=1 Tax=Aminobacter sp. MDW-2 TaxID=2666139 RepID=UPI0012B003B0|nr:alpha/beta hydrolase [Aminobacter sp. MDW-2]MRX36341.1 alpha/beta hydrolase fold domain-containing protein [Aminobacter sp. MDW-2]QNH33801.1 alpha/beta hydrolase [Aminobacter sp. MDW-2]
MHLNRRELAAMSFSALMLATGARAEAASPTVGPAAGAAIDPLDLVDPELRPILDHIPPLDLGMDTLQAVRGAQFPPALPLPAIQPQDRFIQGGAGNPRLRVVVLDPAPQAAAKPAILHIHGGGLVVGKPEVVIQELQQLATELGAVIVSVDYRLAPEHPFPAGFDDAYATLEWMHRSASELGIDPSRIALLGESAGAGLAAAVSLRARDRGELPLRFQALRYPMLDDRTALHQPPAHLGTFIWNWQSNAFGWASVLGRKPVMEHAPEGAVPARAKDLHGLPETWIGVGMLDLFARESMAFAGRLVEAGVPVELSVVPGAYHGFDAMVPEARVSAAFIAGWKSALRRALQVA